MHSDGIQEFVDELHYRNDIYRDLDAIDISTVKYFRTFVGNASDKKQVGTQFSVQGSENGNCPNCRC